MLNEKGSQFNRDRLRLMTSCADLCLKIDSFERNRLIQKWSYVSDILCWKSDHEKSRLGKYSVFTWPVFTTRLEKRPPICPFIIKSHFNMKSSSGLSISRIQQLLDVPESIYFAANYCLVRTYNSDAILWVCRNIFMITKWIVSKWPARKPWISMTSK